MMFRPEIKVLDCTIRDGGLMNESWFEMEDVRKVYRALAISGLDYMEIGYRNSKKAFPPDQFGPWRHCDDDMVRRVTDGVETDMKLTVMMDVGKSEEADIHPVDESPIDVIRVATYVKDIDKAIQLANVAAAAGYETTINIMAISHALERDLEEALQQVEEETRCLAVYIVDSFGALYSEEIQFLVEKYKTFLKTKEVGIHCHNNQQLAFANTIEAIIRGANYLDGTFYGIGRAAGNCPIELLLSFLKNPKFDLKPILDVLATIFVPMREKLEWGYLVPYMLTGITNQHPRSAMALLNSKDRDQFRPFYEKLIDDAEMV